MRLVIHLAGSILFICVSLTWVEAQAAKNKTEPADFVGDWVFVSEKFESPFGRHHPPVQKMSIRIDISGDIVRIRRYKEDEPGKHDDTEEIFYLDERGESKRYSLPEGRSFTQKWKTKWRGDRIVRTWSEKQITGWHDGRVEYRLNKDKSELTIESEQKLGSLTRSPVQQRLIYRRKAGTKT